VKLPSFGRFIPQMMEGSYRSDSAPLPIFFDVEVFLSADSRIK